MVVFGEDRGVQCCWGWDLIEILVGMVYQILKLIIVRDGVLIEWY